MKDKDQAPFSVMKQYFTSFRDSPLRENEDSCRFLVPLRVGGRAATGVSSVAGRMGLSCFGTSTGFDKSITAPVYGSR